MSWQAETSLAWKGKKDEGSEAGGGGGGGGAHQREEEEKAGSKEKKMNAKKNQDGMAARGDVCVRERKCDRERKARQRNDVCSTRCHTACACIVIQDFTPSHSFYIQRRIAEPGAVFLGLAA